MIFVENLTSRADMARLVDRIGPNKRLLHNLLRCGEELQDAASLQELGYSVVLFPAVAVQAIGAALDDAFARLAAKPSIAGGIAQPDRIGAAEYLGSIPSG